PEQAGTERGLRGIPRPAVGQLLRRQVQVQPQERLRLGEVPLPQEGTPNFANRRQGEWRQTVLLLGALSEELSQEWLRLGTPPLRKVHPSEVRFAGQRVRVPFAEALPPNPVSFAEVPFRFGEPARIEVEQAQDGPGDERLGVSVAQDGLTTLEGFVQKRFGV